MLYLLVTCLLISFFVQFPLFWDCYELCSILLHTLVAACQSISENACEFDLILYVGYAPASFTVPLKTKIHAAIAIVMLIFLYFFNSESVSQVP